MHSENTNVFESLWPVEENACAPARLFLKRWFSFHQ